MAILTNNQLPVDDGPGGNFKSPYLQQAQGELGGVNPLQPDSNAPVSPIQGILDRWRNYWVTRRDRADWAAEGLPSLSTMSTVVQGKANRQSSAPGANFRPGPMADLISGGTAQSGPMASGPTGGQQAGTGIAPDIAERQAMREIERAPEIEESLNLEQDRLRGIVASIMGTDDLSPEDLQSEWDWAVSQMEIAQQMGMEYHDPWYWLEQKAASAEEDKEGLIKAMTQVQRTINITDPMTAKALAKNLISAAIGRAPTDEEISMFTDALRGYEEDNPSIVTSVPQVDDEGNPTGETDTTREGGADPQAFADNWLDEMFSEEMDIQRVGTEYFDVARQAVGSII